MTTNQDLLSQFADEYFHLRMLTNKYDNGSMGLYRQISASLYRLLISVDGKSSSLLRMINEENLFFYGSERAFNAYSGMVFGDGVCNLTVSASTGDFTCLVIKHYLNNSEYQCKALFRQSNTNYVKQTFNDWLEEKAFQRGAVTLSRKEFIIKIATEAGGFTHSLNPSESVSAVQSRNPQGLFFNGEKGRTDISFVAESIRELAFEALFSMKGIANDVSDDTVIYKYIPAGYILDILSTHRFGLNLAKNWKDPYEVYPLRKNRKHPDFDKFIDCIYASCWTTLEESDAMWGIYSNGKGFQSAIKVKTTVGRIRQVIEKNEGCSLIPWELIRRVDYMSKDTMMAELRIEEHDNNQFFFTLIDFLYKKRVQFDHENEVRWVWYNKGGSAGKMRFFDIDPMDFFLSMELQPDLEAEDVTSIMNVIETLGYPRDRISQSKLYNTES